MMQPDEIHARRRFFELIGGRRRSDLKKAYTTLADVQTANERFCSYST